MKCRSICVLFVIALLSGCSVKSAPYLGESQSLDQALGRISFERFSFSGALKNQWLGSFKQVEAENGDLLLSRNSFPDRLKKYTSLDLVPGYYNVATYCKGYYAGRQATWNSAIIVDVEPGQETILRCDVYKLEENAFLGIKKRSLRMVVLKQQPI